MIDLDTLGGDESIAWGINDRGDVVGHSFYAGSEDSRAFLYSKGSMIDLGTLGGVVSVARGINNSGGIVGASTTLN